MRIRWKPWLLVIVPQRRRNFILWIPSLVTLLVNLTAFFTDAAFGFDENYAFYRGPLGYVAFIVPVLYMLLILWITFTRFTESKGLQKYIIPGGVVFCMAAAIADSLHGGIRLNEAIMICSILFYYTLHAHDNRRDPLTWLLNRKSSRDTEQRYFWVTVLSCLVLAFEDSLEAMAIMPETKPWSGLRNA